MKDYQPQSSLTRPHKHLSLKEIWPADRQAQILTHHEFSDMAKFIAREGEVNNQPVVKNEDKINLPSRFTLQAYVEPKLDGRYIAYFNDETNDRLQGLRPNVEFEVAGTKYHNQ